MDVTFSAREDGQVDAHLVGNWRLFQDALDDSISSLPPAVCLATAHPHTGSTTLNTEPWPLMTAAMTDPLQAATSRVYPFVATGSSRPTTSMRRTNSARKCLSRTSWRY